MTYLDKLLNGQKVEWKTLGEVAELKRGKTITAKDKKDGNIPVISGGQQPAYYNAEFNREGETITIAGSGAYAGYVLYWNEPIFVSDAFSIKPDLNILTTRYVFHFLLNNQIWIHNLQKGSGVPHVYPKDLASLLIPIPPLSVQKEIVRILDMFTELTKELTKELTLRKKQYEYYREKLLTFQPQMNTDEHGFDVEWKTLGEVAELKRGKTITAKDKTDGDIPVVSGGQKPAYYNGKYNRDNETITVAGSGAYAGFLMYWNEPIFVSDAFSIKPDLNILITKYVFYFLTMHQNWIHNLKKGSGVPHVYPKDLATLKIPIPPLSEQERIVSILDKFDTLVNSISEGLPKEIELRQKQYEYYREKLLSFT